jgi:aspartyl protease family protein
LRRHFVLLSALLALISGSALATDVSLVGVVGSQAVVSVNGSPPHVMAPGSTFNGVQVVSVSPGSAVFMIDGKRESIALGQFYGGTADGGKETATLIADGTGAFIGQGSINGRSVRFMADTGATMVVMSSEDADRVGLQWRTAPLGMAHTANGDVQFHLVKIPTIKVGTIVLNNVDGAVQEHGLNLTTLLGQSFLNRTDMSRSGDTMVLTKRF